MRSLLLGLVALICTATAQAEPLPGPPRTLTPPRSIISPKLPRRPPLSVAELFRTTASTGAVWAADGKSVIYTSNGQGQMDIYRRPITGGPETRVTQADTIKAGLAATPDGKFILFQGDKAGLELNDIYAVPAGGGEPVNLTGTDEVNEFAPVLSVDGKIAAIAIRGKAETSTNIGVLDIAGRKVRQLTGEAVQGIQWVPIAVSRDGRYILANRFDWSFTVGEVHLIEVATGKSIRLTPEGVYAQSGGISPDGRFVSASVDDARGIQQVVLIDVASQQARPVMKGDWEQKAGWFSPDGRSMIVVNNVDGREELYLYDIASQKVRKLNVPQGLNRFFGYATSLPYFSPDGRKLLFSHTSGSSPLDYWVYDIARGAAKRLTRLGNIDTAGLPTTQLVHYPSADGTIISAFLWMPGNLARDGKAAAIVKPHGGPTVQQYDIFDQTALALASRGYVVLLPNYRGSTGYGRAFKDANQHDLGGGDLDDVAAGARFLANTGYVDPKRIGITGGSFGGFMTLMGLAKQPDVWAAGAMQFGIVNWRTMWANGAPQNRRYIEGLVGDPATDGAAFDRASPLTYLGNVRAPLLVIHGENDIRVPLGEAQQIVDRLRKDGKTVDVKVYANEGHGLFKRENQIDALERVLAWFETYLPPR